MIHPNEVRITDSNIEMVRKLAEELGAKYVEALEEQIKRQSEK